MSLSLVEPHKRNKREKPDRPDQQIPPRARKGAWPCSSDAWLTTAACLMVKVPASCDGHLPRPASGDLVIDVASVELRRASTKASNSQSLESPSSSRMRSVMGLCVAIWIPPCRDVIVRERVRVIPALERRRLGNRSRWEGRRSARDETVSVAETSNGNATRKRLLVSSRNVCAPVINQADEQEPDEPDPVTLRLSGECARCAHCKPLHARTDVTN
jgi:hypothetical protein